jgi:WD40 repeat protein/predicted Ser/Thr protein kinase
VKGETLDGLCPQCLVREALSTGDAVEPGELTTDPDLAKVPGFLPPGNFRFGDYELLEVIAHGGMGMVYKARQVSLNRLVALKMLLFGAHSSPAAVHRLRAEAMAAASLHHPNIVAIHEVGFCEGQHFLAMDYVEGRPLSALIAGRPLPPRRAATYLRTIAEAVHHAHEHGVLHRDLKPSNILIDKDDQPQITDFGLAKRLDSDSNLTVSGQVLGSPNYMSPEQARGKRGALTRRSDIYSLGAMLYEMLTGRPPFIGESLAEIVPQVLNTEPLAPRTLNPSVPLDLQTVCLKCLEKDPEKRYPTALGLAEELGRFLEGKPVLARPVGHLGKSWRWCRRQPVRAALAGALVLTFVLGSAGVLWQWRRAEQEMATAQANELAERQNAYAADMSLAQRALEGGDLGQAVSLLDKYTPTNGLVSVTDFASPDLRHWEWRYLRQLCQSDELFTFHRFPTLVKGLQSSSDGRFLAFRKGSDRVAVWDLASRRSLAELPASASLRARNLVFIGRDLLAIGTIGPKNQPEIVIWDANLCREKERLAVGKPVQALAVSADAKLLAILHQGGDVAVLELVSKRILNRVPVAPGLARDFGEYEFGDIGFLRDGQRLVVGRNDGRIQVLEWRTGSTLVEIPSLDPDRGIQTLACSPTEDLVAWSIGYGDSSFRLYDFDTGKARGEFKGHSDSIGSLAFSPDGQLLASAGADQTIRVWDVAERKEVRRFRGHLDQVCGLAFLPDGKTLVSGGRQGSVRLWSLNSTNESRGHARLPVLIRETALGFAPGGDTFMATDRTNQWVALWRTHPLKELERLSFLGTNINGVALSSDGRWLAAIYSTGDLTVWDWNAKRVVTNLAVPSTDRSAVFFSRRSTLMLATFITNVRTIQGWETASWKPMSARAPDFELLGMTRFPISPNEREWAGGHKDGKVTLWTFPDNKLLAEFPGASARVLAMAFSADGRLLASGDDAGYVSLFDVAARRRLAPPFRAHGGACLAVCFSADKRRLATFGTINDPARLWDLATLRPLITLPGTGFYYAQAEFSPDGRTLVGVDANGIVDLWHAPTFGELDAAVVHN